MELGYNNETGFYDFDEWTKREDCLWLVDIGSEPYNPNRFYIIPPPDIVTEIAGGPDDEVLNTLNAFCRDHGMPTSKEYKSLGLRLVPWGDRGFSKSDGYYVV